MQLVHQQSVNFSAARRLNHQWRGDNFTLTITSTTPLALDIARFNQHEIVLDNQPPSTLNVARTLWNDLSQHLHERAGELGSLDLAEEGGATVSLTPSQTLFCTQAIFSAAHRTHAPALSPAENLALYGKCDNPNGHGHNYQLEVWSPSEVDLDPLLQEFDHKNLSLDLPDLLNHNVVTETIAALITRRLPHAYRIRLWETPDFYAECWVGQLDFRLGRRYRFQAIHRLGGDQISGHQYQVWVVVKGPLDQRTETVYDLTRLDALAAILLDSINQTCLNDLPFFQAQPFNLSNLASHLWQQFQTRLGSAFVELQLNRSPAEGVVVTP